MRAAGQAEETKSITHQIENDAEATALRSVFCPVYGLSA